MTESKTTPPPETDERRATVRIDTEPSGKKFQGVWLEFADGKRWVVDYRPRDFWKPFADADVIVTGQCYEPFGQAINKTHFRVDRMKFATPKRGFGPILELWPEQELRGKFVERNFPEGSKMAGSTERHFVDDARKDYSVQGSSVKLPEVNTPVWIRARGVTPDYSYMAQTTTDEPKLWILEVGTHDHVADTTHAPRIIPCPK